MNKSADGCCHCPKQYNIICHFSLRHLCFAVIATLSTISTLIKLPEFREMPDPFKPWAGSEIMGPTATSFAKIINWIGNLPDKDPKTDRVISNFLAWMRVTFIPWIDKQTNAPKSAPTTTVARGDCFFHSPHPLFRSDPKMKTRPRPLSWGMVGIDMSPGSAPVWWPFEQLIVAHLHLIYSKPQIREKIPLNQFVLFKMMSMSGKFHSVFVFVSVC